MTFMNKIISLVKLKKKYPSLYEIEYIIEIRKDLEFTVYREISRVDHCLGFDIFYPTHN